MDDTETISLSPDQRRQVEMALKAIRRNHVSKAAELIDWRGGPTEAEKAP